MTLKAKIKRIKNLVKLSKDAINQFGFRYFFHTMFLELKQNKFEIFTPEPEPTEIKILEKNSDESIYKVWLKQNQMTDRKLIKFQNELKSFEIQPKISIIILVKNNLEQIGSLLDSFKKQPYQNYEFFVHCEKSKYEKTQHIVKNFDNLNIFLEREKCNSINSLIADTTGEWILFLNNVKTISDDALYWIIKKINEDKNMDLIYCDEDKWEDSNRVHPFFKPDWSPDLFLSQDYISNLFLISKIICKEIKFQENYKFSLCYDFLNRVLDKSRNVGHITKILCSIEKTSEEQNQIDAESKIILKETITRRKINGEVREGLIPHTFRIKYKIKNEPKISIIIPTRDNKFILERCINSIKEKTRYKNYEIIIVDNNSKTEKTLRYLKSLSHTVVTFEKPFNFSKLCNLGREMATGDFLLFLNDDTAVINPEWLENMIELGQQPGVGIVGAKLVLGDNTIQHAGWVYLNTGAGIHPFTGADAESDGFNGQINVIRNYSAVTGACLLIKTTIFDQVGKFDNSFDIFYGDSDLCFKVIEAGYRIIYTPYAKLLHQGSTSIKKYSKVFFSTENHCNFMNKWKKVKKGDPFYNPNLKLNDRLKLE